MVPFVLLTRKWSIIFNISRKEPCFLITSPVQLSGTLISHFVPSAVLFTADSGVRFSFLLWGQGAIVKAEVVVASFSVL